MANRSESYWTKRFEQLEHKYHGDGEAVYRALEREYATASREVQDTINAWYQQYAKTNNLTMADARKQLSAGELKEFKWTVDDYIKYGKENAVNGQWIAELERASVRHHISKYEALQIQLQQKIESLYATEESKLTKLTRDVFEDSYYRNAYTVQKGVGIGKKITPLDQNYVKRIISKPWAADGSNFSDRIWVDKEQLMNSLEKELSQMLIKGEAPDRAIKNISERFNVSKSNAGTLVMTEASYFASESQKEVFKELNVNKSKIVVTLDSKTCKICGPMDGKEVLESEAIPGVTVPPYHPRCRCTRIPAFDDMDDWGAKRAARDVEGNYQEVSANITYSEWKKEFVNAPVIEKMVGVSTSNGATVNSVSSHFFDQMQVRKFSSDAAVEALQKPLYITPTIIKDGEPSRRYIGDKATIVYNPETDTAVTGWKTGKKDLKKYGGTKK